MIYLDVFPFTEDGRIDDDAVTETAGVRWCVEMDIRPPGATRDDAIICEFDFDDRETAEKHWERLRAAINTVEDV